MEKITRKEFTEILVNNKTIFAGSAFRWNNEKCIAVMENLEAVDAIKRGTELRTVTENHSNFIVFSNGSRLDFNQKGKKEYFRYYNGNGIVFVMQRTEIFDEYDGKNHLNYIIYIVA